MRTESSSIAELTIGAFNSYRTFGTNTEPTSQEQAVVFLAASQMSKDGLLIMSLYEAADLIQEIMLSEQLNKFVVAWIDYSLEQDEPPFDVFSEVINARYEKQIKELESALWGK